MKKKNLLFNVDVDVVYVMKGKVIVDQKVKKSIFFFYIKISKQIGLESFQLEFRGLYICVNLK